ncbi:fatty acyl-AMP ligase [Actinocrinis sp.]|uniref:fatty acyl-AMP ligase n=1 Tax=Actinocrinis sp. TaxID=1920516 RepID=UPI002D548854|nr:fatty acyl-AMP ligase [Actinocrinis sp.]HZP54174.1 fatty acyl-AMP ligase [Actinocrinis sp.]
MSFQPSTPSLLQDRLRRWATERGHQRAFTFVEFPHYHSPGKHRSLTWAQLYSGAQSAAAAVRATCRPGDRAALLMPQGLDYVTGFLGCLLAGVVAVPLFSPDLPGHERKVRSVIEDCEPACLLVTAATALAAETFMRSARLEQLPVVMLGEGRNRAGGTTLAADHRPDADLEADPDGVAYLQYTSGSTRTPTGVMISHRNVLSNALQALGVFADPSGPNTSVGWLPLFHDMGLLLSIAAPVALGFPSVLMDPMAFLERPARWIRLLGLYPGALSAAPNFAYDYCAARYTAADAGDLRLEQVRALINGSEPVRAATIGRFLDAFADFGLPPRSLCPSYGLAEATVFVAADSPETAPQSMSCRRDELADGRIVPLDIAGGQTAVAAAVELTFCGAAFGQELQIIDPVTRELRPEGVVGEIVVRGPNVGLGYWKRAEQSTETFGTILPGTGERPWLRTGDLGAVYRGRLLVTGRLKDLLIFDGRNHYPQDVEETIQSAVSCVRRDRIAVFAVTGEQGQQAVAVAEHRRDLTPDAALREEADRIARARVSIAHGLRLDRLVLVAPGAVPRTSSGKVSRSACREAFLRGDFGAAQVSLERGQAR